MLSISRLNPGVRYALAVAGLAVLVIAAMLVMHALNTEPRDSRAIASRELAANVLVPGERVVDSIPVIQRAPVDYFRATHGELVLTDRRMVFLGLRPRDLLAPADAAPTVDEEDFPLDTLVAVNAGRTMALLSRAVVIQTPTGKYRF